MKITSFLPIATEKSTILILGTMPGEKSLREQQYYAHPRNAFWPIMETICGAGMGLTYPERVDRLRESGIAIWDVLQHCEREGSLDADITAEIPNDFAAFLQAHPAMTHIFFNGSKAEKSFCELVWPKLPASLHDKITLATLPSTSPANTRLSLEQKRAEWHRRIISVL
jgi:hypoxanthine-DNA glycosylase